MAINLLTFYTRIGSLATAANDTNTYRTTTLPTDVAAIATAFAVSPAAPDLLDGLYAQQTSQQSAAGSFNSYLRNLAIAEMYAAVDTDRPLSDRSQGAYLTEIDRQQRSAGISLTYSPATIGTVTKAGIYTVVLAAATTNTDATVTVASTEGLRYGMAVTGTGIPASTTVLSITNATTFELSANATATGSPTLTFTGNAGDAAIQLTSKDVLGVAVDTALPETLRFDLVGDESRGSTKWQEPVQITGVAQKTDKLAGTWPGGSGTNIVIPISDPAVEGGIVTNGTFDAFTGHTPDDWTIVVGTPSTHVEFTTDVPRPDDQTNCLELIGDGSTDIELKQQVTLEPATRYVATFIIKSSGAPAGSNVRLRLLDDAGVAVTDDALTANTLTFTLATPAAGFTYTWVLATATFITPSVLPPETWLHLDAVNLDVTIKLSNVQLIPMTEIYSGGPSVGLVSGANASSFNDRYTSAVTVSGVDGSVVRWMERFFDIASYGINLKTAVTATTNYADGDLI